MSGIRFAPCLLFVLALFLPAAVRAATNCPWYTQGSAEKIFGGSVAAAIQVSDSGEGSCTFTRQQGTTNDVLKVVIQSAAPPTTCPADSAKLKGVGNEAVFCTLAGPHDQTTYMVVSRVRDLHFTISIATHHEKSTGPDAAHFDEAVKQAAEQVAGNLF
jgi:hypothetical protein